VLGSSVPASDPPRPPIVDLDMTTSPAEPRIADRAAVARSMELVVVSSVDASAIGRRLPLETENVLTLGRGAGEGPHFADPRLSRTHARVAFDPRARAFRVGDGRSRNGTFLQQKRIESAPLQEHDVLRIGDTVLVVAAAPATPERATLAARAAADLSVLILGETGSGKEVLARQLHEGSGRSGPFIAINCAAIPREIIAAELFGHTRGAFSGATRERQGLFRAANSGTILLDEIGDMPLDLQAALLRVLQERTVRPVGGDHDAPIDVRVVSATHADLERNMADGRFRPDLYARLSQVVLRVAPLRQRRCEILPLAKALARARGRELEVSAEAAEALTCWTFPLNVRELDSLVAQFCACSEGSLLLDADFLFGVRPELFEAGTEDDDVDEAPEAGLVELKRALEESEGKMAVAARRLGFSRQKLYRLMKAAGMNPSDFRQDWLT
jgi:DNA-binding NtrC family response regulator